ncbi:MAG TPA: hypothetical protein VIJ51_08735 [Solirubrobacteraceae bacterium]
MRTAARRIPRACRRSSIVGLVGALVGVFGSLCLSAPAAIAAPATGSVTVVGETGSYVTGGHAYRFDSDSDSGSVSLSGAGYANGPSVAVVEASGDGSSFSLSFAAPAGETLQTGEYAAATRYPFESAGQAGIDVSGEGGCNQEYGSFDVKDVHLDASGAVDRLWLVYEVRCESMGAADVFGEVRLNEPATGSGPYSEPTTVQWPGIDLERPARVVPVRIFAGPTDRTVASVALTGPGAADYSMRLDQCTGQTLAAGTSCDVFPRYGPTNPGASPAAELVVRMTDSSVVDVPLGGFAYGGTTEMALESDPGDWIGGGVDSFYDESSADITASGTRESVSFAVAGDDGSYMTADFVPGNNDILVPGATYTDASRYGFSNEGTGMDVTGNGRGCNVLSGEFTVTDIDFDPEGNLLDAGVTFVQHCENGTPALRGAFEWRAQTPAVLAPGIISSTPPVSVPPPAADAPTGGDPSPPAATPPSSSPAPVSVPTLRPAAQTVSTGAASTSSASARQTTSGSIASPPLTETISVPGHQSARTVAASGLRVTVTCSQDCAASVSVRGVTRAGTASTTTRVSLRAGLRRTVHVRLHGSSRRLTLTSSARQAAAPGGLAPTVTRHLVLA